MRQLQWTRRASGDLSAIHAFIAQDSPEFARVVMARIIAATDRLPAFPESGRIVPELRLHEIREVIHRPYRIVYRLVGQDRIHILPSTTAPDSFPKSYEARPNKALELTARAWLLRGASRAGAALLGGLSHPGLLIRSAAPEGVLPLHGRAAAQC